MKFERSEALIAVKAILSICLVLTFFLFLSMKAIGQDFAKLREKAKKGVSFKRPDWKLIAKDEKEKEVVYNWGSAKEGIRILIFYGSSKDEAVERMRLGSKFLPLGPGKERADLGDEAYSSVSGDGNFATIRFRKANVYIEIKAPTMAMAEDVTQGLANEIRKK